MEITIYHNPSCGKSRTAKCLLEEQGLEFETIEYKKSNPSYEELDNLVKKLGIPAFDLIRKNESVFIEKGSPSKLTHKAAIEMMVKNPILIERPIVIKGNKAVIGRPIENVISLLK